MDFNQNGKDVPMSEEEMSVISALEQRMFQRYDETFRGLAKGEPNDVTLRSSDEEE